MERSRSRAATPLFAAHLLAILIAGYATPGACSTPPVEAFGNLPEQTWAVLSQDGHWIAYLDRKGPQPHVVILDLGTRREQRSLAVPTGSRVRGLRWNDNETLLISVGETHARSGKYEHALQLYRTIAVGAMKGTPRFIPVVDTANHTPLSATIVASGRSEKPNTVVMRMQLPGKDPCIADVDTESGQVTPIVFGNALTSGWILGLDTRPVARVDWDFKAHVYHLYVLKGNSIKEIYSQDDTEQPSPGGILADGSAIVMLLSNGRPHRAAWAFPLDGSAARLLVEEPDDDIVQTYQDARTGAVIGVIVGGEESKVHWLEPAAQQRFDAAQRAFPDKHVGIYGWTDDGQKLLALVQTAATPPVVYLVDFARHTADIATEEYPALAGVKLGEVKTLKYPARDGTSIPAYLTIPPDAPKGPGPLLVLVHPDAFSRDYPTFNWFTQFFASRGYTVLQPQFRGSTGFGEVFHQAGFKQWGGLMQDDVSDGVRAMVQDGIADPRRVCIVGENQGGYFALAGAAFTPELYACAVSINGITDLQDFMRSFGDPNRSESTRLTYWRAHMGDARDPVLAQRSPINAVKNVRQPILFAFNPAPGRPGETHSEKMALALKAAGKATESLELPVDENWGNSSAQRVRVATAIETFFNANTKPAN
jgi:dipeptidyl aminopeptidase/acylaminoacyl peptidase